jgi:hypothetical protein
MDITRRELIALKKIQENQKTLADAMKEFHVSSAADLGSIHTLLRRGMVQTVADIFELTTPLGSDVLNRLPLKTEIIKQFRNTASHNYGVITNEFAFACITHCTEKLFMSEAKVLLKATDKGEEQTKQPPDQV